MKYTVNRSTLSGDVQIPGSKSHTVRGVLLAALADGVSTLRKPLASADTEAAVRVYGALGAGFDLDDEVWRVTGLGNRLSAPTDTLDVGNSGTTLRVALGTLALIDGESTITGDDQIQKRPGQPLASALNDLGATVTSVNGNGCAPFAVRGRITGGRTTIECRTSQYLTSLLLACPFAKRDSEIHVPLLYERPYVDITLDWLRFLGIEFEHNADYSVFRVPGNQSLKAFDRTIPADFSTASFFLVGGALGQNRIVSSGLDMNDSQPDKAVVDYLKRMGAAVEFDGDAVSVSGSTLTGVELDLNDTPDALPIMAVAGCFAKGETRLVNVPQARIKETDRIAVMCQELRKMGADVEELEDGLVVRESSLHAADLDGHHDHRVVMSLAVAATTVNGPSTITTAEAAAVTVPQFKTFMTGLGADLSENDD